MTSRKTQNGIPFSKCSFLKTMKNNYKKSYHASKCQELSEVVRHPLPLPFFLFSTLFSSPQDKLNTFIPPCYLKASPWIHTSFFHKDSKKQTHIPHGNQTSQGEMLVALIFHSPESLWPGRNSEFSQSN